VVDLVEDHEAELIAHVLGFQVRRVVGGDGDRLPALFAAAEAADGAVELPLQFGLPLVQQVDGGDDDERRRAQRLDGGDADDGLAAAGRQFEVPAVVTGAPVVEGCLLVRAELVRRDGVDRGQVEHTVVHVEPARFEGPYEGRVSVGRRARRPRPLVALDAGELRGQVPLDPDGSVLVPEAYR